MKTAEEILKQHEDISYMWGMLSVIDAMKEYGRQCSEQTQLKWINVKDRLPENPGSYLTCVPNIGMEGVHYALNIFIPIHNFIDNRVTHWMPLPEPPTV